MSVLAGLSVVEKIADDDLSAAAALPLRAVLQVPVNENADTSIVDVDVIAAVAKKAININETVFMDLIDMLMVFIFIFVLVGIGVSLIAFPLLPSSVMNFSISVTNN